MPWLIRVDDFVASQCKASRLRHENNRVANALHGVKRKISYLNGTLIFMKKTLVMLIATLALMIAVAPVRAETDGYAICVAVSVKQNKMFFTSPYVATQSVMEGMEGRYVQMLRDKRYSNVGMYDPAGTPPPPLDVSCQLYANQSKATQAITDRRKTAAENGYSDLDTAFDG